MKESSFEKLHEELKLSHHSFRRSLLYLDWAFKDINFENKNVLDIGGGNGIYSYYAKYKGAFSCLNLEPFAAGSENIKIIDDSAFGDLKIDVKRITLQEFESNSKFDVIILHDSINHLDEDNFSILHENEGAYSRYSDLVLKIRSFLSKGGSLVVSDCSRVNFFAWLRTKNPIAPSIEWHLHQHPTILTKLFKKNGLILQKLRWSPFKRFDEFGHFLTRFGFLVSNFMQSHYNMVFREQSTKVKW